MRIIYTIHALALSDSEIHFQATQIKLGSSHVTAILTSSNIFVQVSELKGPWLWKTTNRTYNEVTSTTDPTTDPPAWKINSHS